MSQFDFTIDELEITSEEAVIFGRMINQCFDDVEVANGK